MSGTLYSRINKQVVVVPLHDIHHHNEPVAVYSRVKSAPHVDANNAGPSKGSAVDIHHHNDSVAVCGLRKSLLNSSRNATRLTPIFTI